MALFINQDNDRTELQKQLAAELNRKAKQKSKLTDLPDGINDSQFIKGTKTTTSSAWAWALIVILTVVIIIWLTVISMAR